MPIPLIANNATSRLAAGITNSATTISITSGTGVKFPANVAGNYFYATIYDASGNVEIVKVTARSTDSLTIVRGQDGTTARAWLVGDGFEMRPNKLFFSDAFDTLTALVVALRSILVRNTAVTGTYAVPFTTSDFVDITLTGVTTLTAAAPTIDTTGQLFVKTLSVTMGATPYAMSWWGGITWKTSSGAVPALPAASKSIDYIFTYDATRGWIGRVGAQT